VKQVASSTRILLLQIESLDYVAFCFLVFRINRQITGMREAAAAITDQQTTWGCPLNGHWFRVQTEVSIMLSSSVSL